jgi:hypothetical protein
MADELTGGAVAGEMPATQEAPSPAPAEAVAPSREAEASDPTPVSQAGSGDEDDLEDEDEDLSDLQHDPRVKRMAARLRKLNNFAKKARPVYQRVRGLDLDDVLTRARNYDAVASRFSSDPELVQRYMQGPQQAAAQAQQAPAERPQYPGSGLPEQIPFDTSDPGGQYVAALHQRFNDLHRQSWEFQEQAKNVIGTLSRELHELREGTTREKTQTLITGVKSAVDAEVAKYDDGVAPYLRDSLYALFRDAKARGRTDLLQNPAKAIREYVKEESLAKYRKEAVAKAGVSVAQAQAMAHQNRSRPGAAAYTGGTPAPATPKERQTVKSVNARLLGRRTA